MNLQHFAPLVGLLPLFCFADSICGGRPQVPGRGIFYAVPLIIAYFLLFFGMHQAETLAVASAFAMGLFYTLWRGPGWHLKYLDGIMDGSINPIGPKQTATTFGRHCLALPMMLPVWLLGGNPLFLLAFPVIAIVLGVINGKTLAKYNSAIEDVRGALMGLLMFLAFFSGQG